ncbi:MAG: hypothetical protein E6Q27_06135 [Aeromicrobium sp.]|nr:MAG: hypothetical protein E6Q27_06135 [Aeromicrobium sp.]
MKRLLGLILLALFSITACSVPSNPPGSGGDNVEETPGVRPTAEGAIEAAQAYLLASNQGNCEGVKNLVTQPDAVDCDVVAELAGTWADSDEELANLKFEAEVVDSAATITTTFSDGEVGKYAFVWTDDNTWLMVVDAEDS